MNFDNLKGMSREQLLEIAGKQGLSVHWKAKPETIIKQILDNVLVQQPPKAATAPTQEGQPVKRDERIGATNTKEEIEALMQKNKKRQPKLEWTYDEEERNVTVACAGTQVCFNWDQPQKIIQRHLDLHVMRGAFRPMAHKDFDTIHNSPQNAYTGTVLAG